MTLYPSRVDFWLDALDLHPTLPRRFSRCPPPWLWWFLIVLSPIFYFLTHPTR